MGKSVTHKLSSAKKMPKADREQAVLLGLVELYLKMHKPIGSQTLQENGFSSLSSATIRNYFGKMEADGYLKQPHTSGGRVPTQKAFQLYAESVSHQGFVESTQEEALQAIFQNKEREVVSLLAKAAHALSEEANCAVFVSEPRFDQDFVQDVRLVSLDQETILSVLITNFGVVKTETLYLDHPFDSSFLRSCETYFLWRISKGEKPLFKNAEETKLAQKIYNEVMVRHVVGYANFSHEEVIRAGLSRLLSYPEFNDAAQLSASLSLLEDEGSMRKLLRETAKKEGVSTWIGSALSPYLPALSEETDCAILAVPYQINRTVAGSVALLGPLRLPYKNLYGLLQFFSTALSEALTEALYKHQITFRRPTVQIETKNDSILLDNKQRGSS